jgi:DNA-binding XRE family transcriptional regulator
VSLHHVKAWYLAVCGNLARGAASSAGATEIRMVSARETRTASLSHQVKSGVAGTWLSWEQGRRQAMSGSYSPWSDIKAEGRAADPRTEDERAVGKAAARERREAEVRGHQLAEMRTTACMTQAQLAKALGVSQARISKIEHGEVSGIDMVRAYVTALGGTIDVVARIGDRSWKVA